MDPSDAEVACFEAGIKFGSLYHQFAGTPVGPDSADDLAAAMESAIENQPCCRDVRIRVREEELREAVAASDADYVELTGRFLAVEIDVEHEGVAVTAAMAMEGDYPRMRVVDVADE